jgi:hypothetical protein
MRGLIVTLALLWGVACVPAQCQELTGLTSVVVDVVTENGCSGLLRENLIKQDTQVKLLIANIKVVDKQSFSPFIPNLDIEVNCIGATDLSKAANVNVRLQRSVQVDGTTGHSLAYVWDEGSILTCGLLVCQDTIRDAVLMQVDAFIDDYRKQNTK